VDASNDNRIHDFIVGAFVDLLVACLISLHREENFSAAQIRWRGMFYI
jgi:hypothetical protein